MAKHVKHLLIFSLLVISLVILVGSVQPVYSQPGPPGDPCPGGPPCNPDVPISGIEILLAAGGLAGMRKWYVSRKKSN